MKIIKYILASMVLIVMLSSCGDDEIDTEVPVIDLDFDAAFPVNCDTLYFGETFTLKVRFSDNCMLGDTTAYSIDIHNNFDHHSHTTEVTECNLDEKKTAVNPYTYIGDFDIPVGHSEYETNLEMTLPSGNYDTGDYHFFLSITDASGFTAQKGLSIKILNHD